MNIKLNVGLMKMIDVKSPQYTRVEGLLYREPRSQALDAFGVNPFNQLVIGYYWLAFLVVLNAFEFKIISEFKLFQLQYKLTSPIFIMEQYIPLSLKCEPSSRI